MDNYLQKGFYAKRISCNIQYNKSFFRNEINENNIKIYDLEKEILYCKNDVDYIRCFIENIKEKVIKKCKNLNSVKIMLATFDKNNIIHKLMIVIRNMMLNLLKIKENINLYKSIIVFIEYESKIVFIGELNFTGLD
jgi:arginine deiminase